MGKHHNNYNDNNTEHVVIDTTVEEPVKEETNDSVEVKKEVVVEVAATPKKEEKKVEVVKEEPSQEDIIKDKLDKKKAKLEKTVNNIEKALIVNDINKLQRELNALKSKKLDPPKVNKRKNDPVVGDKKDGMAVQNPHGSISNSGNRSYNIVL